MESYNLISGLRGYDQGGGGLMGVVKIALKRDYPRLSKWYAQSKHKTTVGRERTSSIRSRGRAMARGRAGQGERSECPKKTQTHGCTSKTEGTAWWAMIVAKHTWQPARRWSCKKLNLPKNLHGHWKEFSPKAPAKTLGRVPPLFLSWETHSRGTNWSP